MGFKYYKIILKDIILSEIILSLLTFISCFGDSSSGINDNASSVAVSYSVSYNANGADYGIAPSDTNSYTGGQVVTVQGNIYNLSKDNYSFSGWNSMPDGSGITLTQGQTFIIGASDIILYARWTYNSTFTMTYNANGAYTGTVPADTTNYETGITVIIQGNPGNLVNQGYSFTGWNKQPDGSGATFSQGQPYIMGTGNVILYARWTINPAYSVTYNANGADGGSVPVDTTNYEQGHYVTVPGNTGNLVKSGFSFAGWNKQPDGNGTNYNQGQSFAMGTDNVTLYAKWSTTYTLTYDDNEADSGSVPVDTWHYSQGTSAIIKGNPGNLQKSGCSFAGWNTMPDGSGLTYTQGQPFIMGAGNVTLYAQWTVNPVFTVTYDANGAGTGTVPVDSTNYETGKLVTVLDNTGGLAKSGYTFTGWNTQADGNGTPYVPGRDFSMGTLNVVLYAKWSTSGSIDITFDPGTGANDTIYSMSILTDGRIIIVGEFTEYNGTAVNRIARLNTDGTLDTTFNNGGAGADDMINTAVVLPDGRLMIGGKFTAYNGISVSCIARLNSNGTLDTTFDPGSGVTGMDAEVKTIIVQPDDKIIMGGLFTDYNGSSVTNIARIKTDGTLDATFNPGTGPDNYINCITLQPNGRVLIGGAFQNFNGTSRSRVARLKTDGTLDTTFDPGTGADDEIYKIVIQPDGKILVGGLFTSFNGSGSYIARCKDDGSLDTTFNVSGNTPGGEIYDIAVQQDGKILLGGAFTLCGATACKYLSRINPDGSLDTVFDTASGADDIIITIAILPDGKILAGGPFSYYNSILRDCITRVLN